MSFPSTTTSSVTAQDLEEAELLAGLRASDDAAFEKLIRMYGGRLFAVARRILGNEQDAQDALQDALLSAVRGIKNFGGQSRVYTWLHRIVMNAALMRLRSRRRSNERPIDDLLPKFLEDGHRDVPEAEWTEPIGAAIERTEVRELVRNCADQLPESYRVVLIMRDIEQIDTEETARLLGMTTGAVKTRLHRARQALRALLDPHFRGGLA
jgi:RNA polymerase sigma-70 factor (ECF subfamily)